MNKSNAGNQIICGDCLDVMGLIPRNYVLITDPPYGIDYDPSWLSDIHIAKGSKPNKTDAKVINDKQGDLDLSVLFTFPRRLIFGFPYIYDPDATGWLVWDKQPQIDWRGISTPVEVASTTLRKGYDLVHCMWAGYMRNTEAIIETRYAHPTQKPLKVMKGIISRYTKEDDIIFDPFAGSGSTLVAAKQLGRQYLGYEINPDYIKIAQDRLKQEVLL